jgi:hypothetical protein
MTITASELEAIQDINALFADLPITGRKEARTIEEEELERRAGVWEAQPGYDGSPAPSYEDYVDDEELDWDDEQWDQAGEMEDFIDGLFKRAAKH